MRGHWVEFEDFRPAMRDISDLLQLGLTGEQIVDLEVDLDETWYAPGPWLHVPNHGPLDVHVEIALDEIPGVVISLTGTAPEIESVGELVEMHYRYGPDGLARRRVDRES